MSLTLMTLLDPTQPYRPYPTLLDSKDPKDPKAAPLNNKGRDFRRSPRCRGGGLSQAAATLWPYLAFTCEPRQRINSNPFAFKTSTTRKKDFGFMQRRGLRYHLSEPMAFYRASQVPKPTRANPQLHRESSPCILQVSHLPTHTRAKTAPPPNTLSRVARTYER